MAFMLVLQVLSSGFLMPMSAFAATNDNTATTQTDTKTQVGTEADNTKESTPTNATAQDEDSSKAVEEEAKQAVDSLFTNNQYTALAKDVTEWHINTVEVTVHKVTNDQVKQDLQHKVDLARAFVAVNALFTPTKDQLAKGVTQAAIDAADAKVKQVDSSLVAGKAALTQLIAQASKLAKNEGAEEKAKAAEDKVEKSDESTKAKLQTKALKKLAISSSLADYITDIQLTSGIDSADPLPTDHQFKITDDFGVLVSFEFPEAVPAGTEFTYTLPTGTYVKQGDSTDVTLATDVTGDLSWNTDGTVKLKVNQDVPAGSSGGLVFRSWFAESIDETPYTIHYPIQGGATKDVDVQLQEAPKPAPAMSKTADNGGKSFDTKEIQYKIIFSGVENAAKLLDELPAGLSKDSIVSVKKYDYNKFTGEFSTEPSDDKANWEDNGTGTTYSLQRTGGITSDKYEIVLKTTVDDTNAYGDGSGLPDTIEANTAKMVKSDDSTILEKSSGEVTIKHNVPYVKKQVAYDSSTQTVTWQIQYNINERDLAAQTIVDTFNTGFTFGDLKIYNATLTTNGDGSAHVEKGAEVDISASGFTVESQIPNPTDSNKQQVSISVPATNKAYVIEYTTTADDVITGGDITNTATIGSVWTNTNTASLSLYNTAGVKSTVPDGVDYVNKTADWKITLNTATNVGNLKGVTVTDTYVTGNLTLDESSIQVDGQPLATYDSGATVTKTKDGADKEIGFTIQFSASKEIEPNTEITYTTGYNLVGAGTTLKNSAAIDYTTAKDVTKTDVSIGSSQYNLTPEADTDGNKSGVYNPKTKEITWTVNVNYYANSVTNPVLIDTIDGDQNYVAGSLKIYDASVDSKTGVISRGNDVTSDWTPSGFEDTSKEFTLSKAGTINSAYQIVYKTKVNTDLIHAASTYTNTAKFKGDNTSQIILDSTPTGLNYGDEVVEKEYTDRTGKVQHNWKVLINRSQSNLNNVKIEDSATGDMALKLDSFKLTRTDYTDDEHPTTSSSTDITITQQATAPTSVAEDTAILVPNEDGKSFSLYLGDITRSYTLTYSSNYTGDPKAELNFPTNTAEISATDLNASVKESGYTLTKAQIGYSTALAWLNYQPKLKIHKIAAQSSNGVDVKVQDLSGITFKLYDELNNPVDTATTDLNGEVTFTKTLPAGYYYLAEENQLDGYKTFGDGYTGDGYASGYVSNQDTSTPLTKNINGKSAIRVAISGDTVNPLIPNQVDLTVKNYLQTPTGCSTTFINKDGETVLQGSEYKITDKNGNTVVENIKAGSDGKIVTPQLPAGDYTLVQTKLPDGGYDTLAKPTDFKVVEGSCTTADIVVKNSKLCNTVTVNFNAVDPSDMAGFRNGSKFKVVDSNGDIAKDKDNNELKDLTLDSDNKLTFNKLPDGEYKIIQTDTPNGYVKIDDISFNTTDFDDACQKIIPVTIEKCDTFANFEVVGATGQQATDLANQAEFKVVDSNGDDVAGATGIKVVDGKVNVPDLSPGTYKLIQTKAPAGYYAASPQEFVVSTDTCTSLIPVKNYPIPPTPTCPIEFNVVDSKTNNGIGNATFEVKQNGVTVATVTSDASGKVSLPALTVGDYQLVQTSSKAGYDFSKEPISFSVKNDNGTCTVTISTVKNDPKTCPVDITVIDADATNIKVAGATFTIKDKDGKVVAENATSDKDGKIIVKGLVAGDYTLVQTSVPNGYEKSADVSFTVKTKEDGTCENTVVVVKNVPKQCDVVFINKDEETGKVVKGSSTFVVKDQDGKTVTTVTSDSNGKITVAHLKPGTYELVQQKAPSGYEEQSGTITFTVKKGECGPNIVIDNVKVDEPKDPKNDNNKGNGKTPNKNKDEDTTSPNNNKASKSGNNSATFKVTDKDHAHKYKDDVYKLVDENGKTIASGLKVNKDGNIVVEGLPDGDYHLVKLPQTGVQNSLYASLMGLVLVLLGGYAIYRGRRKKSIM